MRKVNINILLCSYQTRDWNSDWIGFWIDQSKDLL